MGTVTYPDPEVVAELEEWLRRSVDVDEEGDLARAFGIQSIPAAVAIDGQGRVLARLQGFLSPGEFASKLAEARGE